MNSTALKEIDGISQKYATAFPKSKKIFERSGHVFPNGSAQGWRVFPPFPPVMTGGIGSVLETVDGKRLLDFWLGHFAMLRGHAPPDQRVVAERRLSRDAWFHLGQVASLEVEVAQLLIDVALADRVVFATSGAQATASACMLARATTKRSIIVKAVGGWHGVQPWSTVAVSRPAGQECLGMPSSSVEETVAVTFNDTASLTDLMETVGDKVAAVILEPTLGSAGMIVASKEYLREARRLTQKFGSCLILDEIVTAFRVRPGPMCFSYDVKPDLLVLGKAISGGMPFAAVCGSEAWFEVCRKGSGDRVMADLGTFVAHPGTLACVKNELTQLGALTLDDYMAFCQRFAELRDQVESWLRAKGVRCAATGRSRDEDIPDFPIGTIRFARDAKLSRYDLEFKPSIHWDSALLHVEVTVVWARVLMLLQGCFIWHGLGALAFGHSKSDLESFSEAYEAITPQLKRLVAPG